MTAEAPWVQNLVELAYPGGATRLWTGRGELSFAPDDGDAGGDARKVAWTGGAALGIGEHERVSGRPERRMSLALSGVPRERRARFMQDPGPIEVTVRWVYSPDLGESWHEVPGARYRGRLSGGSLQDGTLAVELETLLGDVERGRPRRWSHEDQQRRSPAREVAAGDGGAKRTVPADLGLEHMRALARQGVETAWPP